MNELVATFMASAGAAAAEMREALAAGDRTRLARAGHRLKGAADNIGAGRMRELAGGTETLAGTATAAELAGRIEALSAELKELESFFAATELSTDLSRRAS